MSNLDFDIEGNLKSHFCLETNTFTHIPDFSFTGNFGGIIDDSGKNICKILLADFIVNLNTTHFSVTKYPCGEISVTIEDMPYNVDYFHIYAKPTSNEDLIILYSALKALVAHVPGAPIVLFIPYLLYSREDKNIVGYKTKAKMNDFVYNLFSTLPVNLKIYTFDIHSQDSHYINIPPTTYIIKTYNRIINYTQRPLSILYPDKGAYNRYAFNLPSNINKNFHCNKTRDPHTGALTLKLPEEIKGINTDLLIVDDICDGGGTFNLIAEKLKQENFTSKLFLYVSHGFFTKGLNLLKQHYSKIFTTHSTPLMFPNEVTVIS